MLRHLEAKVGVSLCFLLKKYAIRAVLSISNIHYFTRKLLDSSNSRMTKHMVF